MQKKKSRRNLLRASPGIVSRVFAKRGRGNDFREAQRVRRGGKRGTPSIALLRGFERAGKRDSFRTSRLLPGKQDFDTSPPSLWSTLLMKFCFLEGFCAFLLHGPLFVFSTICALSAFSPPREGRGASILAHWRGERLFTTGMGVTTRIRLGDAA